MLDKLRINKKLLRQLDVVIIVLAIIIVLFSCINIYSATFRNLGIYYAKLSLHGFY